MVCSSWWARSQWGQGRKLRRRKRVVSQVVCTLGGVAIAWAPWSMARAQVAENPILQVGVVQRFGEELTDTMTIEALAGEQLTLNFTTQGQAQMVTTNRVVLGMVPEALPEAQLQERVVLSTHRSFESAEHSAQEWQERGIEPEIAQPDGWEVWASREAYTTPLVRRLLVKSLNDQGFAEVYLDSRVLEQLPQSFFEANGYRYHRDNLDIRATSGRIRVIKGGSSPVTRLYGGTLRLQPNTYGTYTLVNDVPIETYLRGVVPHEIGPGAPMPAIEAQAILARTYALRNLRRFAIDDYQLCADTQCQVYWGLGGTASSTDQAIRATQGLVLTYQDELVDALYSSTTGGITAPFSDVWNGPDRPYLRSVVDSVQGVWEITRNPLDTEQRFRAFISLDQGFNEENWRLFRWSYDSTLVDMARDLQGYLGRRQHPLAGLNQVLEVRVAERAASGRVQVLEVETDVGVVRLEKDEIVRVMAAPRSLLFYVEPIYDEAAIAAAPGAVPPMTGYRFVGGGWGHGVGMSQTGSYRLGNLGWNRDRILQFYYPGTTLQPFNSNLVLWRDPALDNLGQPADPTPEG